MERGIDTGFRDKAHRMIHVDDILQHRLGVFGKASGGPVNRRVVNRNGKFQLVPESQHDDNHIGSKLNEQLCQSLVVLRCDHIPT